MKLKQLCIVGILASTFSSNAIFAEECTLPGAPIVPDGNVASEDELVSAQSSIKTYQANLMDYRTCLESSNEALDPEAANFEELSKMSLDKYNASVDAETNVAEEFSAAVRAFRARGN